MPHPEDHNMPKADPEVARELAIQLAYIEGKLDLETTVERLGPNWTGRNGNPIFLIAGDGPGVSEGQRQRLAQHDALRRAWQDRWGSSSSK